MKRRVLSLLLALCMAAALLTAPAAAEGFPDVSDSDTAAAAECLRLMGAMGGYSDGSFRPGTTLNRAQFCKMIVYVMNASSELGKYRAVTVYPDVRPSHWAAPYINLASKGKRVILGFGDGSFHPDAPVTGGQAVTIAMRMLGYKDEDVSAVWPDGYIAQAKTIGLLDGLELNASAALNRGQAAKLLVNLLRTDTKEGGKSFGESVAASAKTHVMLVSSTATGSDGQNTAMEIGGTGQTYQMAHKVSNGQLNGRMGTLLLDKNGKVITFVPDNSGSNRTAVVSEAAANRLKISTGETYSMGDTVKAHYQGAEKQWSEIFQWLTPGTSVTLYFGASGNVEYVFVGGSGSTATQAVVVYKEGSVEGFSALANGSTGYKLTKNGDPAIAKDMRPYDVATYSPATNTIRVTDLRITGVYEGCSPSPDAPAEITSLGYKFKVLPSARESLKDFKLGSAFTLLLTEDNQVAGAVKAEGGGVRGNAIGFLESKDSVRLLNGLELKGTATGGDIGSLLGELVRVSSGKAGQLSVSRLSGGSSGDLDVAARTVGQRKLADNVLVFRVTNDGMKAITLADVDTGTVRYSQIRYARTNWKDEIDLLILGDRKTATEYLYGRLKTTSEDGNWVWDPGHGDYAPRNETTCIKKTDGKGNITWEWKDGYGPYEEKVEGVNGHYDEIVHAAVHYGEGKSVGPFVSLYRYRTGDYVKVSLNSDGTRFASMVPITKLSAVPNSAWMGQNAVTVGNRTYTVPEDVPCYNASVDKWITLDTAHAFANRCDLYVDGGIVRAIEVRQ